MRILNFQFDILGPDSDQEEIECVKCSKHLTFGHAGPDRHHSIPRVLLPVVSTWVRRSLQRVLWANLSRSGRTRCTSPWSTRSFAAVPFFSNFQNVSDRFHRRLEGLRLNSKRNDRWSAVPHSGSRTRAMSTRKRFQRNTRVSAARNRSDLCCDLR